MFGAICRLICGPANTDDTEARLRETLKPGGVGVISASCCAPGSAESDKRMLLAANAALRERGREPACLLVSITDAQRALPKVAPGLSPAEQRLVTQIQSLVSTEGFSVFPLLVVDQKIAFYGGVPTPQMVADKLRPLAVAP